MTSAAGLKFQHRLPLVGIQNLKLSSGTGSAMHHEFRIMIG
jgi:hypothetical protein